MRTPAHSLGSTEPFLHMFFSIIRRTTFLETYHSLNINSRRSVSAARETSPSSTSLERAGSTRGGRTGRSARGLSTGTTERARRRRALTAERTGGRGTLATNGAGRRSATGETRRRSTLTSEARRATAGKARGRSALATKGTRGERATNGAGWRGALGRAAARAGRATLVALSAMSALVGGSLGGGTLVLLELAALDLLLGFRGSVIRGLALLVAAVAAVAAVVAVTLLRGAGGRSTLGETGGGGTSREAGGRSTTGEAGGRSTTGEAGRRGTTREARRRSATLPTKAARGRGAIGGSGGNSASERAGRRSTAEATRRSSGRRRATLSEGSRDLDLTLLVVLRATGRSSTGDGHRGECLTASGSISRITVSTMLTEATRATGGSRSGRARRRGVLEGRSTGGLNTSLCGSLLAEDGQGGGVAQDTGDGKCGELHLVNWVYGWEGKVTDN
ncbi:hypothetical protein BO86DRAFT_423739 [Aspergillus japonicus CBS 114.51]|uniref:Uncharacterized protein n=1 Tax=Aspergillus japonicus CBS 114.51 TaxID=1448312 RepID=A0A8T8XH67_ASPJA|nr:hypothetical protein BO86DRAFT_423739 [Aspergillus japonicus CBS 114.51]RAH87238.1 hypothetical protein BO86DRAFT_423739 [Aspergillus japonicus CBS 114.51]